MIGFQTPEFLLGLVLLLPVLYLGYNSDKRFEKLIIGAKALTIALLFIAAGSTFMEVKESVSKKPEVTVLLDSSRSTEIMKDPNLEFENVKVRRKTISSGNSSDLDTGIRRNIEENKAYLLVSDLQSSSSLKPAIEKARAKNARINILKTDFEKEASVTIEGPSSTVPGAENVFRVRTYSTREAVQPELFLDGEKVELEKKSENVYSFKKKFTEKGKHTLKASIDSNDRFSSNNEFFKTIKVSEKPQILLIGSKGALREKLSKFYDLTYRNSLPSDLSEYYAVIAKKDVDENRLSTYVAEGNGFIYTGDVNRQNSLLPVRSVDASQESKGAKIMLAIDISKSTESDGSVKKEKQIAYSLAEKLPFNNKLGAVAYNQEAYLLSKPKPLATNRANLKTSISRLETGGNSFHHKGLKAAEQQLGTEGNIILITDGKITAFGRKRDTKRKSLRIALGLRPRLITVGVGKEKKEKFLKELASRGDGFYLDASQSGRLNFMFKAGGAEEKAGRLVKVNTYHFITEGLPRLETQTTGYDSVKPKIGSDLLVSSTSGKPFLTSWRYGLGRVAAFTGGSPDLNLVLKADPLLVTRTVSWAVGQPNRKKEKWIEIPDGRKGEEVEVKASYSIKGLKRERENLYSKELLPKKPGFHSFGGEQFGYSYNPEIERIGYREENEVLATRTGGKVFKPDEKAKMKEELRNLTDKKIQKKKPLADYLIAAALLIFLGEIGYRKRKGKK